MWLNAMAKTEMAFLSGFDPACPVPLAAKSAALTHRFAVIQETYRPDSVDMFFDEPLFRALMRFAAQIDPDAVVTIDEKANGYEVDLLAFLTAWELLDDDRKGPDAMALARVGGELVLCIAPEHWANIGGPMPYADSYTYSIFSKQDIGARVMAFLAESEDAVGWQLNCNVLPVPERPTTRHKSWLRKILEW
jgi:hypothetical protein